MDLTRFKRETNNLFSKRKPILVFYLDVRNKKESQETLVKDFRKSLEKADDLHSDYHYFIIPYFDDSKVELLNPILMGEDEYEKFKDKAELAKLRLINHLKK